MNSGGMGMHQRNDRLINVKINQYLIPGIMMSLSLQLGNILDTIMVGNFLGTDAMTAVSLSVPVETILQMPGYCLGTGGALAAGVKFASQIFYNQLKY